MEHRVLLLWCADVNRLNEESATPHHKATFTCNVRDSRRGSGLQDFLLTKDNLLTIYCIINSCVRRRRPCSSSLTRHMPTDSSVEK